MKNLSEWLDEKKLLDIYDSHIAQSRSNPRLVRADGLNRVDYEETMQHGYGRQLLDKLRNDQITWNPNLLVKIEKDNGTYRDIEIPSHDVHLVSAALLERYQAETQLPEVFYCRRRNGVNDKVGVQDALKKARHAATGKPVLNLDIEDFFGSVRHDIIREVLKGTWHPDDIELALELVTLPTVDKEENLATSSKGNQGQGLCQGNPLSPLLAQFSISDVPQIIDASVEAQIWYVDDLLLVLTDPSQADKVFETTRSELALRGLALHTNKVKDALYESNEELSFLRENIRSCPLSTPRSDDQGRDKTVTASRLLPSCKPRYTNSGEAKGNTSAPTTIGGGKDKGGNLYRENDLNQDARSNGGSSASREGHQVAQPAMNSSRSPSFEIERTTDLVKETGMIQYQSPSLRDFEENNGMERWIGSSPRLCVTPSFVS
jgi:hypothetical protein